MASEGEEKKSIGRIETLEDKIKSLEVGEKKKKIPLFPESPSMELKEFESDKKFEEYKEKLKGELKIFRCEELKAVIKACYNIDDTSEIGVLALTQFRCTFKFNDPSRQQALRLPPEFFSMPYLRISAIEKTEEDPLIQRYSIIVTLKDTRVLKFYIAERDPEGTFYNSFRDNAFPPKHTTFLNFSFDYLRDLFHNDTFIKGWDVYEAEKEYTRQGAVPNNKLFRTTKLNENYSFCPTYPKYLVVRATSTDEELKAASEHRTKNRLPVLAYYYNRKGITSCLWRSSQSKSGLTNKKSEGDVKIMEDIIKVNGKLTIFDARPKINAYANKINGGGFEDVEHYTNAELIFCDIDNIHDARKSLTGVYTICQSQEINSNQSFHSNIEGTDWYEFIHRLLKFSDQIVREITNGGSVLVHCSDGWDRTAQLTSLSELLIDPYYRTIEGFAVLVEKEWLSFGHQFGLRNGIYLKEPKEDQRSPIFLQWLDCVHQLIHQFPNCFEFTKDLPLFIAKNYMVNIYGTFMFNNAKEREENDAEDKTASIWGDVLRNKEKYKNIYYDKENVTSVLKPNYATYNLLLWKEFFFDNSPYLLDYSIYLGEEKLIEFGDCEKYFEFEKNQDDLKYKKIEEEMELQNKVLEDIAKATNGTEVFSLFGQQTQSHLQRAMEKVN